MLAAAALTTSCVDYGRDPTPQVVITNSSEEAVSLVYLWSGGEPDHEAGELGAWTLDTIAPGEIVGVDPHPYSGDDCLRAPLVIRGDDGRELDRIDEGTCYEDPIGVTVTG